MFLRKNATLAVSAKQRAVGKGGAIALFVERCDRGSCQYATLLTREPHYTYTIAVDSLVSRRKMSDR